MTLLNLRGSHEFAIAVLAVAFVFGFGFVEPRFLAIGNLIDILRQTAVISILAFAMTAVIAGRGIDMSVGGILALAGMALGLAYEATGSWVVGAFAALGVGAGLGALNGVIVGVLGINAFLATFAMLTVTRAAALVINDSSSIIIREPVFIWIGQGSVAGIPASVLLLLFLLFSWVFLLTRTRLGRWIFAVGNNPAAAKASLLPVAAILAATYVLSGVSAALGAIITVGRLGSAQPLAGAGIEFAALTAAVIGGARLSGGQGSIVGTFLGALLLGSLGAGLSFLQISQQMTYVVTGVLVIAAVLITDARFRERAVSLGAPLHRLFSRAPVRSDLVTAGVSPAWEAPSGTFPKSHTSDAAAHHFEAAGGLGATGRDLKPLSRRAPGDTVEIRGLSKSYSGVRALDQVSLSIRPGKVLALLGENGAGKSTLVKCLAGAVKPDSGTVRTKDGEMDLVQLKNGIECGTVHQHFSLAPDLSLVDNLVALGRGDWWAFRERRRVRARVRAIGEEFGLDIDAERPIGTLTVGQRQIAEIAKAIIEDKWLIIMDEPTSALSVRERDSLFRLIRQLTTKGIAVVYISHKMEEIFEISEYIAVLRDGRLVGEVETRESNEPMLIQMMVGRKIEAVFPYFKSTGSDPALVVDSLSDGGVLRQANITVNRGEIVGVAGLMGSGRSELLRCIAGLSPRAEGRVIVDGKAIPASDPTAARDNGIAFVPEDRLSEGIFADMSVADNLTLCWLSRTGFVASRPTVQREAGRWIEKLDIRPRDPSRRVGSLSGGNQQKVVVGKYLAMEPTILLLDEPTQGVDIGAKAEIHRHIGLLKQAGVAILLVSSELPELLGVADRIIVMARGRSSDPIAHGSSPEAVMQLALRV